MRCPTLAELPPPPPGRTGWPWTVDTPPLPELRPDGSPWPRISIVTPSYNQGEFIEETIRSVLLQGYPNLEYVVMDGNSNDDSVEIIRKYEPWIANWESQSDHGQSHAINKGLSRSTGEIAAYLNSDDFYLTGALGYVSSAFARHKLDLLLGRNGSNPVAGPSFGYLRRSFWREKMRYIATPLVSGPYPYSVNQESSFWNAARFRNERFDEALHFCMDYDWFVRMARRSRIGVARRRIGFFRRHDGAKSARLQDLRRLELELIWKNRSSFFVDESAYRQLTREFNAQARRLLVPIISGKDALLVYDHP